MTEKIQAYLDRINFTGAVDCSSETLCQLQYAHVTNVPYENLDILKKIPLSMEYEQLYDKIVTHRRGGYCFELNGLFGWLLRELGFDVVEYTGRFLAGETTIPMRRHRILDVKLNDKHFLCDVGVGVEAPKYPLEIVRDVIQEQGREAYQMDWDDFYGHIVLKKHKGQWERFYSFTEEPQANIDFVMPSYYCENHEDSIFNKSYMISLKTSDGRMTMDGNLFKIYSPDGVVEKLLDDSEVKEYLEKYFKL